MASWSLQSERWRQPYDRVITVKSYWCNYDKYVEGRGEGVKERGFSSARKVRKVFKTRGGVNLVQVPGKADAKRRLDRQGIY